MDSATAHFHYDLDFSFPKAAIAPYNCCVASADFVSLVEGNRSALICAGRNISRPLKLPNYVMKGLEYLEPPLFLQRMWLAWQFAQGFADLAPLPPRARIRANAHWCQRFTAIASDLFDISLPANCAHSNLVVGLVCRFLDAGGGDFPLLLANFASHSAPLLERYSDGFFTFHPALTPCTQCSQAALSPHARICLRLKSTLTNPTLNSTPSPLSKTFTGRRSTLAYTTPGPPQDADDLASQLNAFHLNTDTMTIDYQAFAEVLGNSLKDALVDVFAAKALSSAKNYIAKMDDARRLFLPKPSKSPCIIRSCNYVAAPDAFDGSRAHYETFRRSIELYVKAIPTDSNKILAALSFLTQGDADAWAQNWVQAHDLDKKPETWARFLKDLDEKFLDPHIAENARESLAKLTQGRDPADSFFLKFDELRTKAGFVVPEHHDIVLVDYLCRNMRRSTVLAVMSSYESKHGLTDGVTDAYHEAGVIDKNQYDKLVAERSAGISYKEFRALALNQDPIIRLYGEAGPTGHAATAPLRREPNGQFIPRAGPPAGMRYDMTGQFMRPAPPPQFYPAPAPVSPAVSAATSARNPDPMDVDRARARALGLCYRCKKPGHLARDCQEKNFKDVIRGLNVADLEKIANIVAGTSTLTELVETQEEEDKDFSVPQ
ncbi:hypothetical protein AURDEDRAFT_161518 [Auricularia subglabra TFB-10046 SS5]|nr:hypothetical protein AURDEDRAFT_161518 [Auricularia subglabra TFB-10046 SS5]